MAKIHQAFEAYLKHDGAAHRTAQEYARTMRRATADGQATKADLEAWYAQTVRGKSRSTQTAYAAAIRRWADWRGMGGLDLPAPRGAKAKRYRNALSDDEYVTYRKAVLASKIPVPVKTVLLLLPETGLRVHEACSLHWRQIKTDSKGRRFLEIHGKRDTQRRVPLNAAAQGVMDIYCRWPGAAPAGFLFPSAAGSQPFLSPKTVRQHLEALRTAEGWTGTLATVSPHVMRHTFASRLINRDVSVKHVQALLGHTNISTTEAYLHPDDESLHAATASLTRKRRARGARRKND